MTAPSPEAVHEPQEQYDGPAGVLVDAGDGPVEVEVQVRLRGHFQPIDGRFHWYGRVGAQPDLEAIRPGSTVTLRTPYGEAPARLSDLDPWGRLRLTGTGRPPF